MQKQVSVYKNNLPGDKSKIATVEEAVVFLRKCDVVMLQPECREFISQIMKGTKSALCAKFYRSVPSVLSTILDKPMLFAAMLDSPLASYIPDTLHTGARDFCVDILNSFVDGHLQNMLAQLAELRESKLAECRDDMKTRLVWPMNRRSTSVIAEKRKKKSILLQTIKVPLHCPDGARGKCATVLQKFGQIPSTRVYFKPSDCRWNGKEFVFQFQLIREHFFKAIDEPVSASLLKTVGDTRLIQAVYSDQTYRCCISEVTVKLVCDIASPALSKATMTQQIDDLSAPEMKSVLTQGDLYSSWLEQQAKQPVVLQDDYQMPLDSWPSYPFLCQIKEELFTIESFPANSITMLPNGLLACVIDTGSEPTMDTQWPERYTEQSQFRCYVCFSTTGMKFACRWDCGHFCCVACAFRFHGRNRCHICRADGQGLAVDFVAPSFRMDPDSTLVDYAYLLDRATQVPALQQTAKLLLELAKNEVPRGSGSTEDQDMPEVVNNSGQSLNTKFNCLGLGSAKKDI